MRYNWIMTPKNEGFAFEIDQQSEIFDYLQDEFNIMRYKLMDINFNTNVQCAWNMAKRLLPLFNHIEIVYFYDKEDSRVGVYIAETASSTPVILFNTYHLHDRVKEDEIVITIFHELGHALFELDRDICGGKYLSQYKDEESFVEKMARQISLYRELPNEYKEIIKDSDLS